MKSKFIQMVLIGLLLVVSELGSQDVKMVKIVGGTFKRKDNRGTVQTVSVSSFYLAECEITVQEWIDYIYCFSDLAKQNIYDSQRYISKLATFIDSGKKVEINRRWPAFFVSWGSALEYCNWLSMKNGLKPVYNIVVDTKTGRYTSATWDIFANGYRLPTEAEWEIASGVPSAMLDVEYMLNQGWLQQNSDDTPHEVKTKPVNKCGVYDMFGNVGEFCWDLYNQDYYSSNDIKNPKGPTSFYASDSDDPSEEIRVIRGGGWFDDAFDLSKSPRAFYTDYFAGAVGFRIAKNIE